MGLSICSQLARLMGGELSVQSLPGSGSAFQFIAAFTRGVELEPPASGARPARSIAPLHVLLTEDSLTSQLEAIKLLSKMGHRVKVVSSGLEAIQAWEHTEFDLILMDNQMPELDGIEAVKVIRAREAANGRRRTLVLTLTASAMAGDRERFLAAGMDGYLGKPFNADELAVALEGFLPSPIRD